MSNGKKHFKRGAAGDKGGHNPINTRPPQEYLCVVGSCSNTYTGYMTVDPATNDWVARPRPINVAGVPSYIVKARGNPPEFYITHDMYWANFVAPAVKLFTSGIASPKRETWSR
jgi:hypothetical protein